MRRIGSTEKRRDKEARDGDEGAAPPWYRTIGNLHDREAALYCEEALLRCRNVYIRLAAASRDGSCCPLAG